ncbi:hypothetical protein [Dickeya ananatis]|uniref:hypothetical protein n=1 Tax=Dickeya ananatis TaxID=3061286 RepID=UPI003890DDFD
MTELVMVVMKHANADYDETRQRQGEVCCIDMSRPVMPNNGYRRVPVVELAD